MKMKDYWYYMNEQDMLNEMSDAEERAFEWEMELKKEEMRLKRKEKRNEKYNHYA